MSNGNNNIKIFDGLVSKTKAYLVIIAILLIILCFYEYKLILPSIFIYFLILIYTYWTNKKRKAELSEHIKELTINVDKVSKRTLINSPFPLIIVETDGNVIWKSTKFVEEFANVDINNYLTSIIKEIKLEIENSDKKDKKNIINNYVTIGKKDYRILGEYVKSKENDKKHSKEYMATLHFIDETEKNELEKKYNDSNLCVGIIMIDNYEEIMQRLSSEDRHQLIAKIEKSIYDWAINFKGLIVKSERETFVCVFEQKYLSEIEDKKFSILDTIKELNVPGKMQSTLSIAVSNEGVSYYKKYLSAQATMDIVLGRGGDQAVVRQDGRYKFFGGRTQEVEKRTRVKARVVAHALEELISEAKDVMIMGHVNGDMDSMGSSLGVYRIAKTMGKEAYIVAEVLGNSLDNFIDEINKSHQYEEVFINKQEAKSKISPDTLLIVVDTHKKSYVEDPELLDEVNKIVIIDHHRKSTEFIDEATLVFQEVYASSAAELVTELIEYSQKNVKLSELEVQGLYAGIMMDTKNFTFKTGVRTFEAAAYLRKCGADIIRVKKWFQSDLETYSIISEIVSNAEIVNDNIAISIFDKGDINSNVICAKAADELLSISNITASFVIGHLGEKVCISGRSIGDINVQMILEKLGGGGHITLAGAQVEGMKIEEVKQELIKCINEYFSESSGK